MEKMSYTAFEKIVPKSDGFFMTKLISKTFQPFPNSHINLTLNKQCLFFFYIRDNSISDTTADVTYEFLGDFKFIEQSFEFR